MMQECIVVTIAITETLKQFIHVKGAGAVSLSFLVSLLVCAITRGEIVLLGRVWLVIGTFLGANGLYLLGKNMFSRANIWEPGRGSEI